MLFTEVLVVFVASGLISARYYAAGWPFDTCETTPATGCSIFHPELWVRLLSFDRPPHVPHKQWNIAEAYVIGVVLIVLVGIVQGYATAVATAPRREELESCQPERSHLFSWGWTGPKIPFDVLVRSCR